jgi:glycerophosphoryl diester phosphodiesterase
VLNVAHRGASGRFPENTLAAFAAAIDAGAQMCELDVQLTRDGAVVVMHDDTVDRTTDGCGAVRAMMLDELKRLDAGVRFGREFKGERVPTLAEVFALTDGRCGLNIEIKAASVSAAKAENASGKWAGEEGMGATAVAGQSAICARVCEQIVAHRALATAMVSSFDWAALAIVRHLEPRVRIGLLSSKWPARLVGAAFEMHADAINPRSDMVTEDLCIAAHQRNLSVYAWTVDEPAEMLRLFAYGVDGIMTNYPERLRELTDY